MRKLVISHNAGFFSCCSIALTETMIDFNLNKGLAQVDRTKQYSHYKTDGKQNLVPLYFNEGTQDIPYNGEVRLTTDKTYFQFSDYRLLCFDEVKPFMDKFFAPSQHVLDIVEMYENKYNIDYENTCGVLYRGNDKNRETSIAPYEEFNYMSEYIYLNNEVDVKFFILPDETEFLEYMDMRFDDVFTIDEIPHMHKKDSAMFYELPLNERAEYAAKFLAGIIIMSKCKHLITHSGNVSMWCVLYRGNTYNVHQWLNDKWIY